MQLFNRNISISAGAAGEEGVKISTQLDIVVKINKKIGTKPPLSTFEIKNLSATSAQQFAQGNVITVQVGYGDASALIFTGDINESYSSKSNSDTILHVKSAQKNLTINKILFNKAYKKEIPATDIIKDIESALGTPIIFTENAKITTNRKDYSYTGLAIGALRDIVKQEDLSLHLDNDTFIISNVQDTTNKIEAPLLTPNTGLLEIPILEKQKVKFTCLFNSNVLLGEKVELKSNKKAEWAGVYIVKEIFYNLSTKNKEYYQKCVAYAT